MDVRLQEMINHVERNYNGDFDMIPDGPKVTWAEMQLVQIVKILARRLDVVELQLNTLIPQETRLFGMSFPVEENREDGNSSLPNSECKSRPVVADRCNYVICTICHMTGPVGNCEEEAIALWNRLPRRGAVEVTELPKCDCGQESIRGRWHYCYDETPVEGE